MEIIYKKTSDLIPYDNNSRTHSEEQVKQICASINEFGFTNPVLIDEKDMIIAGHGRVMAAEKLKMEEVPCIVLAGLTETQKNGLHPTMKPIALCSKAIENSSKKEDIVLDLFGGSGSTLIACEQLGRNCYTMELDPKYVDVIIQRWENFTGQKAVKLN